MRPSIDPITIDQLLPQTQCGLCGYGGCMPYAEAIAFENAALNLCPPGGERVLKALGTQLQEDITPHLADMREKAKPPLMARIREAECIGCTKCIDACPVDAIIGGAKQMHSILISQCTGCELCVPPCPVDCIDLIPMPEPPLEIQQQKANTARERYHRHQYRLAHVLHEKNQLKSVAAIEQRQHYIQDAINRVKNRKRTV